MIREEQIQSHRKLVVCRVCLDQECMTQRVIQPDLAHFPEQNMFQAPTTGVTEVDHAADIKVEAINCYARSTLARVLVPLRYICCV